MLINGFYASIRKTTIVDVDIKSHHLPPDLGEFTEFRVADYPGCPKEWSKDGIFIPVKEGEPMWFDFRANRECAVLCSVQRLNPVTGEPSDIEKGLTKDPVQNYLSLPKQKWLDGYVNNGKVYQFVVTKKGIGLAVNEFVLPEYMRDSHAIGFAFFAPKVEKQFAFPHNQLGKLVPKEFAPKISWKPACTPQPYIIYGTDTDADSDYLLPEISEKQHPSMGTVFRSSSLNNTCYYGGAEAADGQVSTFSTETYDIIGSETETKKEVDQASMGMGGRILQRIETDNNTVNYYLDKPSVILTVYMALPELFNEIMEQGNGQDSKKEDKFVYSGEIGGVQIPLITNGK